MDVVYLGATSFEDNGDWVWASSNASLNFTDWHGSEPQLGRKENCAAFYSKFDWQWVNIPCRRSKQFICEIPIA